MILAASGSLLRASEVAASDLPAGPREVPPTSSGADAKHMKRKYQPAPADQACYLDPRCCTPPQAPAPRPTKRRATSPRIRFEVFKRDDFTCVYCGQRPPNVLLQADHLIPVKEGGSDDITNLVTSCSTCNAGKGAIPLSDTTRAERAIANMEAEQERVAVMEAYGAWRLERAEQLRKRIEHLEGEWKRICRGYASSWVTRTLKRFCPYIFDDQILEAMEISRKRFPLLPWDQTKETDEARKKTFEARQKYFYVVCRHMAEGDRS